MADPTGHTSCFGANADDGPQCYQPGKINNLGHNQPMGKKAKVHGCSYDDDQCLIKYQKNQKLLSEIGCGHACSRKDWLTGLPDPIFSDGIAPMIQYTTQMIGVIKNADNYEGLLKVGLKDTSVLSRAINPDPWGDLVIGSVTQAISDISHPDLNPMQKALRAGGVGLESGVTGFVSDVVGGGVAIAGEIIVPEGGGVAGIPAMAITSALLDAVFWPKVNQQYFGF